MTDTESLDFHPKLVNPYYRGLVGFNFIQKDLSDDPMEFIASIKGLRNELSNAEILLLLNHNWRPSKVGAWIIGLCQISELEKDLIEYLQTRPIHCEHVLINLTLFNTQTSRNAINDFIEKHLELILNLTLNEDEFKAVNAFETNSLLWAFNAVKYLDSINHTNNFENLLASKNWTSILAQWSKISETNPRAIGFKNMFIDAESKDLGFANSIELIRNEDNSA